MAPSLDNDNTPKAPDRSDKQRSEKAKHRPKEGTKDEKLSDLNDKELKALLDEAINYKNPKDREGKSELFNDLLLEAEESERIARATSAGGSELVRHCNPKREGSTHIGSLDNLSKEELFKNVRQLSSLSSTSSNASGATMDRVSARSKQGGSLPCNVNTGGASCDPMWKVPTGNNHRPFRNKENSEDLETAELLQNDHLAQNFEDQERNGLFTSSLNLDHKPKPENTPLSLDQKVAKSKYSIVEPLYPCKDSDDKLQAVMCINTQKSRDSEDKGVASTNKIMDFEAKRVDENANALHQPKVKKKKIQTDKNVVVVTSEMIEGHKKDIIDNVEELVNYIEGTDGSLTPASGGKARSVQSSKSRQLHKQHTSEEGRSGKKRHLKGKEGIITGETTASGRAELKKSNSMGEISGIKLDAKFPAFGDGKRNNGDEDEEGEGKVILRMNKLSGDRPRERRSWGNELPSFQSVLCNASSMENLETATASAGWLKPKKKSKKRRNSVSSSTSGRLRPDIIGGRGCGPGSMDGRRPNRAPSPDYRTAAVIESGFNMTRSMPHSEKSNDSSSDEDSANSLPIDSPISYADIAKNSEKKKPTPDKTTDRAPPQSTAGPNNSEPSELKTSASSLVSYPDKISPSPSAAPPPVPSKIAPPDVHNIKSFPAITACAAKTTQATVATTTAATTSDKAVQSTMGYDDGCDMVRERTLSNPCSTPRSANFAGASNTYSQTNPGRKQQAHTCTTTGGNKARKTDMQSELSIIQANESMHLNAPRLPDDVLDVQTIEKMQLMMLSPPPSEPLQATCTPSRSPERAEMTVKSKETQHQLPPKQSEKSRHKPGASTKTSDANYCDSSEEATGRMVNGVSEDVPRVSVPDVPPSPSPPPVIILSGTAKEVPDLVFGFDINEQLLQEDTGGGGNGDDDDDGCDSGATAMVDLGWRFVPPPEHSVPSQHLEKIVNFIGSAWESVLNQKVQYYSEDL